MTPGAGDAPSDPGLAGERTALAWARTGLSLLAVPGALAVYAVGRDVGPAAIGCLVAGLTGLALLVSSLRRQRVDPGFVGERSSVLAVPQVLLAALTVLLIDLAALIVVLR
jgi:uncharacterized membrane protein YidH (DUF202 family)